MLKVGVTMNRIKQLREKKNLSQKDFVTDFNIFLDMHLEKYKNQRGVKTITFGTASRWENNLNHPTEFMWQALADYFNVSIAYLKGAYSKDEILKMLQKAYKEGSKYQTSNYYQIKNSICFNVDLIMIAHGFIEPNEPSINGMLSQSDVNNFEFWKQNFSFIFESVAMGWLISRPIEVSDQEILKAINEAIQIELSKLATDTRERQDKDGYWLESPSKYLSKRQEFINNHINDDGTLEF